MDTRPYIVEQGDYLLKLAVRYGFDTNAVWNHPSNATLKKLRDPNVLFPGDVLYVPEQKKKWFSVKTGQDNAFTANVPMVPVSLTLHDHARSPLKNIACTYEGLSATATAAPSTTDASGMLHLRVPTSQAPFVVVLPSARLRVTVRVGHMDPITERTGVLKRLSHLGFGDCPITDFGKTRGLLEMSTQMEAAFIAAYQIGVGRSGTGAVDSATTDALLKVHGV